MKTIYGTTTSAKTKDLKKVHASENTAEISEYYDPNVVICSLCGDIIADYTPKYFMGEEINPACELCDHSDSDTEEYNSNKNSDEISLSNRTENLQSPPKSSRRGGECTSDGLCKHSPVCTLRQPRPPPLPTVRHLRNERSKYHVHMMSKTGIPGRYGGHERCLDAYSKNYGCADCVWLKWNGEIHGFPDINPHDYEKYLDPT